jgi:hypothetical protein
VAEAQHVGKRNSLTEEYTEYYANLIGSVASLRSMESIDVLLVPVVLETGGIATNGVAVLGDAAFPKIKAAMKRHDSDSGMKVSLLITLGQMIGAGSGPGHELSAITLEETKNIARVALTDRDEYVRGAGVRVLAYFSDPDSQRTVLELANAGPDIPNAVRVAARSALGLPVAVTPSR